MSYHLRIKVCGVTCASDAQAASALGADALGLNFYPGSARYIDHAAAAALLRELPPLVDAVGVFVQEPLLLVAEHLRALEMASAQWHGDNPELAAAFPFRLIVAFRVRDASSLKMIDHYLDRCAEHGRLPAAVLVDAHVPGQHGGTGQTAPWHLLASFRPPVPLILAGGLTADNVAEAVRLVQPYAVDVASGVECAPGRKDAEKLRRFIGNAREAAARLA